MTLAVGNLVDKRYRVLRLLGEGGMGYVYLAENERIDRKVAIKVLRPSFALMDTMVVRFEREARAAARIGSPHIADVIDLGFLPSGEPFVVMEYLEGESLAHRLKKGTGRLSPREVAPIALQLLEGLSQVHDAGIVHRDLKPANIFLAPAKDGDFVKLLDFGVSKFREGLFTGTDALSTDQQMLGTPSYMAPEQARNQAVDARTDLYSVGAVLYRCVTGLAPFSSENRLDLLLKIVGEQPRPIEVLAPDVDPTFARIVRKAMAKNPADRFATAAQLGKAIADWYGRIDRLLADFLGIHHAASIPRSPVATRTPASGLPPARQRLISKVIVEPDELEHRVRAMHDAKLDELVDELLAGLSLS
jgi:eukaryotic-like serine/threonine-protein kinase